MQCMAPVREGARRRHSIESGRRISSECSSRDVDMGFRYDSWLDSGYLWRSLCCNTRLGTGGCSIGFLPIDKIILTASGRVQTSTTLAVVS